MGKEGGRGTEERLRERGRERESIKSIIGLSIQLSDVFDKLI